MIDLVFSVLEKVGDAQTFVENGDTETYRTVYDGGNAIWQSQQLALPDAAHVVQMTFNVGAGAQANLHAWQGNKKLAGVVVQETQGDQVVELTFPGQANVAIQVRVWKGAGEVVFYGGIVKQKGVPIPDPDPEPEPGDDEPIYDILPIPPVGEVGDQIAVSGYLDNGILFLWQHAEDGQTLPPQDPDEGPYIVKGVQEGRKINLEVWWQWDREYDEEE